MAVHLISLAFSAYLIYLSAPGTDLFSWHPTCMAVAFILLSLQAIVLFSPESTLFPTTPRADKVQLHWILNTFGVASAAFGFFSIYVNKELNQRKHFVSWHAKFGLATFVSVWCVVLGGVVAKYNQTFKRWARPVNLKLYHATAGMLVFTLAMATIMLACYSNWFKNRVKGWAWRVAFGCPLVLAVCVMRQVTQNYMDKILVEKESEADVKAKKVQARIEEKLKKDLAKQKLKKKTLESPKATPIVAEEINPVYGSNFDKKSL